MNRRLEQSIEKILSGTSAPDPTLNFNQANLKQAMLKTWKPTTLSSNRTFSRQISKAFGLASLGLLFLISGGAILAQANKARPGDALYSLNRALERTQLALAQDEVAKLELKLDFAGERLDEATSFSNDQTPLIEESVTDAKIALREIDTQLDAARIALELNQPAELTRQDVTIISNGFQELLAQYKDDFNVLASTVPETLGLSEIEDIQDIFNTELSPIQDELSSGYYLELDGVLAGEGTRLRLGDIELNLSGELVGLVSSGEAVRVTGVLAGNNLDLFQIRQGFYRFAFNEADVIFEANTILQQDELGVFIGDANRRFDLTGPAVQDTRLIMLVGQSIKLSGIWQGEDNVRLIHASSQTSEGSVEIIEELSNEGSVDSKENGEALPAENTNLDQDQEALPETE